MHEQDLKRGLFLRGGGEDTHGIKTYIQGNLIFPPAAQRWLGVYFLSFFYPQNDCKLALIPCPTVSD